MKRTIFAFTLLLVAGIAVYSAVAQPPGGGRGQDGRGAGGPDGFRPPPHPLEVALDTDGDGQLSAKEIENAVTALKTLDKNEDGKLDADELRPRFGRRPDGQPGGGRGFRRPDGDRPEGAARERDPARPGNAEEMLARMLSFDKNEDGKLTKDELPERMQGMIARGDTNGDGAIDKEELAKLVESLRERGDERRPRGDRPDGRGPDGRGAGRPDAGTEGRGGPGGPPSPENLVTFAMRFDADGDEKLSREELLEFARQMQRRRGGEGNPEARGGQRPPRGERPEGRDPRPDSE